MIYLGLMLGDGSNIKRFTAEELMEEFNKLPFIKTETKLSTVKKYLVNYKNLNYVTATSIKDGTLGRPKKVYKISEKGIRILKEYLSKWSLGQPLLLKKKHKKFKMTSDYRDRASAIRGKMNDPEYKKNCLSFILTQRMSGKPSELQPHP